MTFNYEMIPSGFYDQIFDNPNGMRKFWHWHKFDSVIRSIQPRKNQSLLDVGCFAGSFVGRFVSEDVKALSVDVLPTQIEYAKSHYETPQHHFKYYENFNDLSSVAGNEKFDYVTFIEVIEHLDKAIIKDFFLALENVTHKGSEVIITTPNYTSLWPVLELLLNQLSDVKYEEQHVTKFTYWNMIRKLQKIYPPLLEKYEVGFLTSSHLISPFVAIVNYDLAKKLSNAIQPSSWMSPLGCILILKLVRK